MLSFLWRKRRDLVRFLRGAGPQAAVGGGTLDPPACCILSEIPDSRQ
jgi:hypothetical protein